MNIEEQVLTIEQARHLQKLGLDMSDAALCWAVGEMTFQDTTIKHQSVLALDSKPQQYPFIKEIIPTYTLQEMFGKLPTKIEMVDKDEDIHEVFIRFNNHILWYDENLVFGGLRPFVSSYFKSPIIVAYEALCWVLENGYLKEDNK